MGEDASGEIWPSERGGGPLPRSCPLGLTAKLFAVVTAPIIAAAASAVDTAERLREPIAA